MDFFASQDLARRKTRWLIFYFVLAVICMIVGVYIVALLVFDATRTYSDVATAPEPPSLRWLNPALLAGVSAGVLLVVGAGSLYKIAQLRGGGETVASMLGGRHLPPNSRDPDERKILNVVEEMALAAGTPVPPVYIIDNEPGINAFAAGYTVDDAVIGINRGTIEQLSRDELQGVVAHEFSHILNGDMRMSIRLIGILHGILLLALIGYFLLRGGVYGAGARRSSDGKGGGGAILAMGLGLIVVGSVGLFFARIIKASVSRQREYLADASAVQFTRNPDGIAGALKMIGASMEGSVMHAAQAEEASHMFFASMFKRNFGSLFATHPPLDKRIRRIDPRFDGDYTAYAESRRKRARRRQEARREREARKEQQKTRLGIGMPGASGIDFPGVMGDQFPIDPLLLVAGIGLPDEGDVGYSEMVVERIPEALAEAARDVFSARCIVFAALLNDEDDIRRGQLQAIASVEGQATIDETVRLMPMIADMDARCRLPVFEILQGTLTGMSPEQYNRFRDSVNRLVEADQQVDLFEFFLRHHLIIHLDRRFGKRKPPRVKYRAINPLKDDVCQLLAIVAKVGHEESEDAKKAFQSGVEAIDKPWREQSDVLDGSFSYASLESSLERIREASPKIKKRVLTAMAIAITWDKQVTVEEAELFRAMSESLDCPVPPVVANVDPSDGTES